jgi:hypothetical protein
MRNILLSYQTTEAWSGLSQEDKDAVMHAADDVVEELSTTREWVGGEEQG